MSWCRNILITILLVLSTVCYGQVNCLNTLREAKKLYRQGLIDEIPDLLSGCMETGFTRAQRIEAYKLIILTYLFDDDQFAAENMMDEFLRKFPEYEVMPDDPTEFVYLLDSYKTSSYYSINFTFGTTLTTPQVMQYYSMLNHSLSEFNVKPELGYFFGLGISRNLWKPVDATVGFRYSRLAYQFQEINRVLLDEDEFVFAEIEAEEFLTRYEIPLSLTYTIGRGNFHYAFRAGIQAGILSSGKLDLNRNQPEIGENLSITGIEISNSREKVDYSLLTGFTFKYKIPRGYLVIDARYNMAFNNINIPKMRYNGTRLNSRYYFIDNDFRIHGVAIGIGYHLSIYQSGKNRF